jgi:hypothetical protein
MLALKSGRALQGLVRPISDTEVEVVTSATETVRVARSDIDAQSPAGNVGVNRALRIK